MTSLSPIENTQLRKKIYEKAFDRYDSPTMKSVSIRVNDIESLIEQAVVDELKDLASLPNVYPEKIDGEYTHVEAIFRSAITNRIAELQDNQGKDVS